MKLHHSEDLSVGNPLYERMEQFLEKDIHKWFGLSWTEFINRPKHECDKLLELASKRQKSENTIAGNVLAKMENNR